MSKHHKRNDEAWLLLRFGGMGDAMFVTVAARALHRRLGYRVHVATNESSAPLLEHNPDIEQVFVQKRMGPVQAIDGQYPADLVQDGEVWVPNFGIYERYKAANLKGRFASPLFEMNVTNYYRVIENSTHHPMLWPTQISDFHQTIDEHLAWAHIDPHDIPAIEKRPVYVVSERERAWATKVLAGFPRPLYFVQAHASSPVRTFYRTSELMLELKSHPGTILNWEPSPTDPSKGLWRVVSFRTAEGTERPGGAGIPFPDDIPGIRATAALLEQASNGKGLLVSADTCVSHVAEALDTFHTTYYTSVPAWTRSLYYTHEFTVDARIPLGNRVCKCGIIGRDCPRKIVDSFNALHDQERELLRLLHPQHRAELQMPPADQLDFQGKQPHEFFNMTPEALKQAVTAAVSHYEAMRQSEAYCLAAVDLAGATKAAIRKLDLDPQKGGDQ